MRGDEFCVLRESVCHTRLAAVIRATCANGLPELADLPGKFAAPIRGRVLRAQSSGQVIHGAASRSTPACRAIAKDTVFDS